MTDSYFSDLAEVTGMSANEVDARLAAGRMKLSPGQAEELSRRQEERTWKWFEVAAREGDYSNALSRLDVGLVANGLLELDDKYGLTDGEVRTLLREHWASVDAPRDAIEELLALFQRVGYVADTDCRLDGTLTIYRGTFGDDPRRGISWTLSEEKARWFANRIDARDGIAGRLTHGEKVAAVWRATIDASDLLGYFVEREEEEVVVDPKTLRDVRELGNRH